MMVYVDVSFDCGKTIETKEFHTPYNALRFMYGMRGKGHFILGYRCDDPIDAEWLNKRFKL